MTDLSFKEFGTAMRSLDDLHELVSLPSPYLIEAMASLSGDFIVFGAGGKLGPNLIRLMRRADEAAKTNRRIYAVSRFSSPDKRHELEVLGTTCITADVLDEGVLESLPDARNVLFLIGARFGMAGNEPHMWMTNTFLPGQIISRYRNARVVMMSTGNVYPLVELNGPWPTEDTPPEPVGEYAMSCLGRERIAINFGRRLNVPLSLIRLNYSIEMRYGPIVDLVRRVKAGAPIDLSMGYLNMVWQGYSNEVILRSFLNACVPAFVLNVTGKELTSVRGIALRIASLLDTQANLVGSEAATALLSDASLCHTLFGAPHLSIDKLIDQTVEWIQADLPLFTKETGFQNRSGNF